MNERDVCRHYIGPDQVIGTPCPNCGHADLVHPGFPNPSLEECVVCRLLLVTDSALGATGPPS